MLFDYRLGKNRMYLTRPVSFTEKYGLYAIVHEATHLIDANEFHWTSHTNSAAIDVALESSFEKEFPSVVEAERRTQSYREGLEKFRRDFPKSELEASPLDEDAKEKALVSLFEMKKWGKDFEGLKESVKKFWIYKHRPVEEVAFAVEVAFLRDEGLTLDQRREPTKRALGAQSYSKPYAFDEEQVKAWYEDRDLMHVLAGIKAHEKELLSSQQVVPGASPYGAPYGFPGGLPPYPH